MKKITKDDKSRYKLLAIKWTRSLDEGVIKETKSLHEQLLNMEQEFGMTAEEILNSDPEN